MLRQEAGWVQTAGSGRVISPAHQRMSETSGRACWVCLLQASTNPALAYRPPCAMLGDRPALTLAARGAYPGNVDGDAPVRRPDDAAAKRRQQESAGPSLRLIGGYFWNQRIKIYGQETTSKEAFAERNRFD